MTGDEREARAAAVIGDHAAGQPTSVRRRPQLRMSVVTAVLWVLLWGDLSVANLVSGFVLGMVITWVFPLPPIETHGRFRLWPYTKLIAILLFDLVRSSFVVAAQAFHFGHTMRNAVVRVDLRTRSDLYLTLTSELVSLVPGSLVTEARRQESVLYVHVMDVRSEADIESTRREVLEAEERVVRSFGTDEEVAALKDPRPDVAKESP
ncbi:MAG TPA: Na+/H+ antiporter subunit E [Microlunatus sp.]|jgi:multicomponent Na+:H+ antiporter subunit E|nr:Na+/H+ antiporter subunit E [Microlunatus sp.]